MRPTNRAVRTDKIAVDLSELQNMLSCGKTAAYRIAQESGAGFNIGRRKLYSVAKIRAYMDKLTETQKQEV